MTCQHGRANTATATGLHLCLQRRLLAMRIRLTPHAWGAMTTTAGPAERIAKDAQFWIPAILIGAGSKPAPIAGSCWPWAMVPSDWLRVGRGEMGRSR